MKKSVLFFAAALCAAATWAEDVVTAQYSSNSLDVALTNSTSFVAFQMDITVPEGTTNEGVQIQSNEERLAAGGNVQIDGKTETTDFKVLSNVIGGNKLRVIAYNLGNNAIAGASGEKLFTLSLPAQFTGANLSNIRFVDTNLTEKVLADVEAIDSSVVGIDAVVAGSENGETSGNSYDLQGRLVKNAKGGIFVTNGKKQIVK